MRYAAAHEPPDNCAGEALSHELMTAQLLVNYHRWIFREIQLFLGDRVAEIGGGLGMFSTLLIRHHVSIRPTSILEIFEPAKMFFSQLSQRCYAQHGEWVRANRVRLINTDFVSSPNAFNTAILVNVLEHIEDDLDLMHQIYTALAPGGTLIIFSPALPCLYSKLDRMVGHYRRYTKHDLTSKLTESGFAVAQLRYMDATGVLPWYLINVLGGSSAFNPHLVKAYDRLVVPIVSLTERYFAPPIGKNILAVGQKPSC